MGNSGLCCSERDSVEQQKEQNFILDDAKRKKLMEAGSSQRDCDDKSRMSTLQPTLQTQPTSPPGKNGQQQRFDTLFKNTEYSSSTLQTENDNIGNTSGYGNSVKKEQGSNKGVNDLNMDDNFEYFINLFKSSSKDSNKQQLEQVIKHLNEYIYSNFTNKQKHQNVENCIILFENQCQSEKLYEIEVIYRIYHSLLCFLNSQETQAIQQLSIALKICKTNSIIHCYQSLIYCFLSLSYIQKEEIPKAKKLFIYSNRLYQAHFTDRKQFPRNNFYQILVFAQILITYRFGYFKASLQRLEYLEQMRKQEQCLLIQQKYISFMMGMNKMELDNYKEAQEHFESTLKLVTNNETRQGSANDFSKLNSEITLDKNIFDILMMNIISNKFNTNNKNLQENIKSFQDYKEDYSMNNKEAFQMMNKVLTVIQ